MSLIPIDMFHKLLHTPGSICTFARNQLKFLNVIDGIEMSQVSCHQLPK